MRVSTLAIGAGLLLAVSAIAAPAQTEGREYRLLATNRTSTMEEEMNEAAAVGFRVNAVMGGETSFGGSEAIVIMSRIPNDSSADGRYQYKLLATNRTSTMQEEMQEAGDAGFEYVGQTVFNSTFGGQEVAVVLERDVEEELGEYEYLLLATKRTSTMQEELQEAGENNFSLVGMTVHGTTFGGNEVVAILRRSRGQ